MYKFLNYLPISICVFLLFFSFIVYYNYPSPSEFKYKIEDSRGNVIYCNDYQFVDTNTIDVLLSNGDTIELVDVVDISNQ